MQCRKMVYKQPPPPGHTTVRKTTPLDARPICDQSLVDFLLLPRCRTSSVVCQAMQREPLRHFPFAWLAVRRSWQMVYQLLQDRQHRGGFGINAQLVHYAQAFTVDAALSDVPGGQLVASKPCNSYSGEMPSISCGIPRSRGIGLAFGLAFGRCPWHLTGLPLSSCFCWLSAGVRWLVAAV